MTDRSTKAVVEQSSADVSASRRQVVKALANTPGRHTAKALNKRTAQSSDTALTAKVRAAVEAMVLEGRPRAEAALLAGLTDQGLFRAFRKVEVRKYYEELLDVFRSTLRARAIQRIEGLMDTATSESIRLQAAKYLDGQENNKGLQINIGVQTNVAPGYITDARSGLHHGAAEILQRAGSVRNVEE